jgi:predicted nucleic acid-binding Zn ribbon protein/preprotein translocase subunit SecD
MKRFCSQCGKELDGGILICPKCGFENKKRKNKKKVIVLAIILFFLIISGVLGYLFRNQLVSFIGNPLRTIAQLRDPDYQTKEEFKESYERYLLDLHTYLTTMGYPLDQQNANDYETVDYKVNGSTDLTTLELYERREATLKEIEEKDCFREFNINSECDNLRETFIDNNREIWLKIENKSSEYRFCGNDKFEHFVPTCEAALDWKYLYNKEECTECNNRIQDLLTLSSSIQNPELAEALLNLAVALEEYNEANLERLEANREILEWRVAEASNKNSLRIVESLSPSELVKEYQKEEYEFEKALLGNMPITKTNLTNHYNSNISSISDQMDVSFEKRSAYTDIIDELTKNITSYISIVNGAFSLNLSKLNN